jgi:hypothetical protein
VIAEDRLLTRAAPNQSRDCEGADAQTFLTLRLSAAQVRDKRCGHQRGLASVNL